MESSKGKVAICTGANTGIGYHVAKSLASQGYTVVLACRNEQTTKCAIQDIRTQLESEMKTNGSPSLEFIQVDLSSLDSIRRFAAAIQSKYSSQGIHVLANNAGILRLGAKDQLTVDNLETTAATNHFGPFLLTLLLLPLLKKSGSMDNPSKVIHVASRAHIQGDYEFGSIQHLPTWPMRNPLKRIFGNGYWRYCNSKLYNVMFSNELQRRLDDSKIRNVVSNAVHPGLVATSIFDMSPLLKWLKNHLGMFYKTPIQGAEQILYACTLNKGGMYLSNKKAAYTNPKAKENNALLKLWDISRSMVGLSAKDEELAFHI